MNAALEIVGASVPGRLVDVSLKLERGVLAALVGPNGSGKSTLLQLAAGVLPAEGGVRWAGKPYREIEMAERGRCATWVPQEAHFEFGFTVESVVAQGRFAHGDDGRGVAEAMRQFELNSLAKRPVTRLSGGERHRVLLARAVATAAPLQLWDEPLAALDVRHALQTLKLAHALARAGTSLLISLHDLRQAHCFDVVIVLDRGRLRGMGSPNDVLTPALLRDVFGVVARTTPGLSLELP